MITMQIDGSQYQFPSPLVAEREAVSHLDELRTQAAQARKLSCQLDGVLCARPYRTTQENRLASLRAEIRTWHDIRRRAVQSRYGTTG
ncbi:MAG: hypothetical protein HQL87_00840 [Magnetococcales bacterium]|nr:hypothetical protein [Magnetococcales bacterium]